MEQVTQYCEARHQLELSKRAERAQTLDLRERRAFALETLDAGIQAADLRCCEVHIDGNRFFVCVKEVQRARVPAAEEVNALIDQMRHVPADADGLAEAVCAPFRETVRKGVSVSKKLPPEGTEPTPIPAHLEPHVATIVQADAALSGVRKSMQEDRKAARKRCKAAQDEALETLRGSKAPVRVQGRGGAYHVRYTEASRRRKASLRDIAEAAKRVGSEVSGADAVRLALKSAVADALEPDDEPEKTERLRYALA